jgi:mannose-6-phosphate isomerase-like protein (cupin superfamily)
MAAAERTSMSEHDNQGARIAAVDPEQADAFDWGIIQWLVSARRLADSQMTFGYVEIKPGMKNIRHYHPNCDEVLFLLEGELDHSLGEARFPLRAGMAIHIPMGTHHDAVNRGDVAARMVVAYSSGDRRTVMLEGGQE